MDRNSLAARARDLAAQIDDNALLGSVDWVLDRPTQKVQGVTKLLKDLRKYTVNNRNHNNASYLLYGELGCVLGELFYEHISPGNPYTLSAYTSILNEIDKSELVIQLITQHFQKYSKEQLTPKDIEHLTINLSTAYKRLDRLDKSIEVLEAVDNKTEAVINKLAENYSLANEPRRVVEVIADHPLNPKLAITLGRALRNLNRRENAMEVTAPFTFDPHVRRFREQLSSDPKVSEPTESIDGRLIEAAKNVYVFRIEHAHGPIGTFSGGQKFAPSNQIIMGDAVGVAGPHARVGTISAIQNKAPSDITALITELRQLGDELRRTAKTPPQNASAALVHAAAECLDDKPGDGDKVTTAIEILKGAGKFALDTATRIGTKLAGKLIEDALDLPPSP